MDKYDPLICACDEKKDLRQLLLECDSSEESLQLEEECFSEESEKRELRRFLRNKGLTNEIIDDLLKKGITDDVIAFLQKFGFSDDDIIEFTRLARDVEVDDTRGLTYEHNKSLDNIYLFNQLMVPLKQGLSEVVMRKPRDPIDYLAQWLLHYKDLEVERCKMMKKTTSAVLPIINKNICAEKVELSDKDYKENVEWDE